MNKPVNKPVSDIDDLRTRVLDGRTNYAILLAGGLAHSRKTIRMTGVLGRWRITNHIDDTRQTLTDAELWTESNIGTALDHLALVER